MAFNILTTTIRGYAEDLTSALKIDTIQNRLDSSIYDKIINYLNSKDEVCNVTRFSTHIHGGIQPYFDYLETNKSDIDAVVLYTSENSIKNNLRETNFILDYLFIKKIPTVVVSLKDDGTFMEALLLVQHPVDHAKRSFSKLLIG